MFDDDVHKNAMKEFIAFLRTMTTQKNIAFFSDDFRDTVKGNNFENKSRGYVNGAQTMVKSASKVGHRMGSAATQSLADSSRKLSKMVDMSFDSSPTIRPVVDMTDIKKQANSISTLFSDPLMSSTGNIRAIRTIVDNRQNGNDDIVSSINKLRKDLGNVGNTYNSINGITYDNGSEISEAVGTLVRAARIERRR